MTEDRAFWVFTWLCVAGFAGIFIAGIVWEWVGDWRERRRVRRILGCPTACRCKERGWRC